VGCQELLSAQNVKKNMAMDPGYAEGSREAETPLEMPSDVVNVDKEEIKPQETDGQRQAEKLESYTDI
jgi:hypothetical protein